MEKSLEGPCLFIRCTGRLLCETACLCWKSPFWRISSLHRRQKQWQTSLLWLSWLLCDPVLPATWEQAVVAVFSMSAELGFLAGSLPSASMHSTELCHPLMLRWVVGWASLSLAVWAWAVLMTNGWTCFQCTEEECCCLQIHTSFWVWDLLLSTVDNAPCIAFPDNTPLTAFPHLLFFFLKVQTFIFSEISPVPMLHGSSALPSFHLPLRAMLLLEAPSMAHLLLAAGSSPSAGQPTVAT